MLSKEEFMAEATKIADAETAELFWNENASKMTSMKRAMSSLKRRITKKTAEVDEEDLYEVTGLLAGERDHAARKAPIRMALLSSTGRHIELSTWSHSAQLDTEEGGVKTAKLETPAIIRATVYRDDYGGVMIHKVSGVRPLTIDELVEKLEKVVIYDQNQVPPVIPQEKQYPVVVLKMNVKTIYTPRLEFDGDPIELTTNKGLACTFVGNMIDSNGNEVKSVLIKAALEPRRSAKPVVKFYDLADLVLEMNDTRVPGEQAAILEDGIYDRRFIVVGTLVSDKNDSFNRRVLTIGVHAIVEEGYTEKSEAEEKTIEEIKEKLLEGMETLMGDDVSQKEIAEKLKTMDRSAIYKMMEKYVDNMVKDDDPDDASRVLIDSAVDAIIAENTEVENAES